MNDRIQIVDAGKPDILRCRKLGKHRADLFDELAGAAGRQGCDRQGIFDGDAPDDTRLRRPSGLSRTKRDE